MAFGSKKEAVTAFKKAHEDASKLSTEMQADIDSKKQKIELLESEIGFISETQKEAQEFMSNLEKFIQNLCPEMIFFNSLMATRS